MLPDHITVAVLFPIVLCQAHYQVTLSNTYYKESLGRSLPFAYLFNNSNICDNFLLKNSNFGLLATRKLGLINSESGSTGFANRLVSIEF